MGYEPWTSRRRRLASFLTRGKVTAWQRKFDLPYCGEGSPYPSDYVEPLWAATVIKAATEIFPGVFVDVGANIGQTLITIKLRDPDWEYIGFEPNPFSWVVAQRMANANGMRNFRLIPCGLSDKPGILELFSSFPTDPAASVIKNFRDPSSYASPDRRYITVMVGSNVLDDLGCKGIGIVKIDVEGGELEVMNGLNEKIKESRPLIVCEILPVYDAASAIGALRITRQLEIEESLRLLDYRILRLEPPKTYRLMNEIGVHADLELTDYVFVPNEKLHALTARLGEQQVSVES